LRPHRDSHSFPTRRSSDLDLTLVPMSHIRSVAVLGAGTMGSQIAAHFANAGVPALLLDVTPDAARDGMNRARALKPDPFFTRDRSEEHTSELQSRGHLVCR